MQTELSIIATALPPLVVGFGLLAGIGLVPMRIGTLIAAGGLAYLCGLGLLYSTVITLMTIGVPFTVTTVACVAAILAVLGFSTYRLRRRSSGRLALPTGLKKTLPSIQLAWKPLLIGLAPILVGAGVIALVGIRATTTMPITAWDGWSIWNHKALLLLYNDSVSIIANQQAAIPHPDYPLLIPLLEATQLRWMQMEHNAGLITQFWLILLAFPLALTYLCRGIIRPAFLLPLALGFTFAARGATHILSGYADIPLSCFVGIGAAALGVWLFTHQSGYLYVSGATLAGACATKNEGIMVTICILLALTIVAKKRGNLKQLALAWAIPLAAITPWKLWLSAHHITSDLPLQKGINPIFLFHNINRVPLALDSLQKELASQSWLLTPALAFVFIAVSLATKQGQRVAIFYGLSFIFGLSAFLWAFWISPYDLTWHLSTAADRVVTSLIFINFATITLLFGIFYSLDSADEQSYPFRGAALNTAMAPKTEPGEDTGRSE